MIDQAADRMRVWFGGLQPRERRMVQAGAAVLAVLILVGGILMPLAAKLSAATARRDRQRADLAWMQAHAAEIRDAAGELRQPTNEPPVVLVDRTARASGLAAALRGTQPSGADGVRVQLEAAPFDTMMIWIASLDQRYGLTVESITVDRAAHPGTVNANVTFTPPHP